MSVSTAMASSGYAVSAYGARLSGSRLRDVCDSGVQYATVSYFSHSEQTAFSYTGGSCGTKSYTQDGQETTVVVQCSQMQEDIPYCQSKGVKILLSVSAATYHYEMTSEQHGKEIGQSLYDAFGPRQVGYTGARPFDSASQSTAVDGYVLDIMSIKKKEVSVGIGRTLRKQSTKSVIAACLQCNEEILSQLEVDYVFVQFDKCQSSNSSRVELLYEDFVTKIRETKSRSAKIFIGFSAYHEETESSHVQLDQMERIACQSKRKGNFAGFAFFGLRFDLSIVKTKSYVQSSYEAINGDTCEVNVPTETSTTSIVPSSSTQAPFSSTQAPVSSTQAPFTSASTTQWTTSTVYTTIIHTVTDCPATVTDCPVGQVTTETISLYTTVCPQPTGVPAKPSSPVCQGSECNDDTEDECSDEDCFEECVGEECVEECFGEECVEECVDEECVEKHGSKHGSKNGSKNGSNNGSNNGCVGAGCVEVCVDEECVEKHGSKHGSNSGCVGTGCAPAANATGVTNGTNSGCVGIYCPTSTGIKTACVGAGCPGVVAPTNKWTGSPVPSTTAPVKAGASSVTLSLTGLAALMVAQLLL